MGKRFRNLLSLGLTACVAGIVAGGTWASDFALPAGPTQPQGVQISTWPAPVPPSGAAPITWQVQGGADVSHTDLHWGIKTGLNCPDPLPNTTWDQSGGAGTYADSLTMPPGNDYLCFRIHATVDGTDYYDPPSGADPKILPAVLYGNSGNGTDWGDGTNYCNGGICWETDHPFAPYYWGYVGGSIHQVFDPISGTLDVGLYQTQRQGVSHYKFWVSTAYVGTYEVWLRFAELDVSGPGQRVFDVLIEGQPKLTAFDLYAASGGKDIAYDQTFTAVVADGELTVEFVPRVGQPVLNAISVRGISATNNSSTATPTATATVSGTVTSTVTATATVTSTATTTATATATTTATRTPTATATATATSTPTATWMAATATATPTASSTPSATATATATEETLTPEATATGTATASSTPSATATPPHAVRLPVIRR